MKPPISIIIPTWNNEQFLNPCVYSIFKLGVTKTGLADIIIVNNGKQNCQAAFGHLSGIKVVNAPTNLGWEGGLKLGLQHTEAPFVCFQNDDTFIPHASAGFYERLLAPFQDQNVACVGPATTTAAGIQSIYHPQHPAIPVSINWLIFFTVMVRRAHLEEVGGIDDTLPGGDDLDLCFRFKTAGKKVIMNPTSFLIHHGFKTGTRVKGDQNVDGGWNSVQMKERTDQALIRKHDFKTFFSLISDQSYSYDVCSEDKESEIISALISPGDKVVELGCGGKKTVPQSIGVDRVMTGGIVPIAGVEEIKSVAEVNADITEPLPFDPESFDVIIARHIFEHCVDLIKTIEHWKQILKPGGRLIVAVPDHDIVNSIPLDPTHYHAFTQESLERLLRSCGLVQKSSQKTGNGISFISVFEKSVAAHCSSNWIASEVIASE